MSTHVARTTPACIRCIQKDGPSVKTSFGIQWTHKQGCTELISRTVWGNIPVLKLTVTLTDALNNSIIISCTHLNLHRDHTLWKGFPGTLHVDLEVGNYTYTAVQCSAWSKQKIVQIVKLTLWKDKDLHMPTIIIIVTKLQIECTFLCYT